MKKVSEVCDVLWAISQEVEKYSDANNYRYVKEMKARITGMWQALYCTSYSTEVNLDKVLDIILSTWQLLGYNVPNKEKFAEYVELKKAGY